ncbi:putative leukotoxin-activating lysine-acyltransferase LktC serotype A1 [Trichinella spiralis]|uniref:Uncharacterized protein n=1 Tax=Trichinella spiralis TaxID=6334 RepID=E5S022_TRISP|nr:putative leukotoxin-activating lysine-acyltransferase LktC serotype A1 [Trichinella spiralis]KRY30375.1 hypothetical protein T01_5896 [Trichinella spiralis]KRY30383.1 hypothetical protein T01_7612 [Trichinella spiralis]
MIAIREVEKQLLRNLFSIPAHHYLKIPVATKHCSWYENNGCTTPVAHLVFLNGKTMEEQLSGEKVSVLSYICHNSGGQLLKKRQSEMWLTARLFRPRLSCTV